MVKKLGSKKYLHGIRDHFHRKFNIKIGIVAGIITGSIVFCINYEYGLAHAFFAFGKQFLFNFFMASYNTKLVERLVYGIRKSWLAIIAAGIVPTIFATSLVFLIHYFGQTPKAWQSSYWQAFFNLPIFTITALMYKTGFERRFRIIRTIFVTKSSSDPVKDNKASEKQS
ncbi:MAG: hypothetical protein PF590_02575 [Candidatus Delongbacteria bacterium]|jgi:hypothetical protein|nr:hypothetical protein [Candidatus Delongbacteria bacterium]